MMGSPEVTASSALQRWTLAFGLLTLAISWLVPNHYPPWTSLYNESAAAIALMALAVANMGALLSFRAPATTWLLVACALIPQLQWWAGLLRFSGDAWVATLYVLGVAMSVAVGSAWAKRSGAKASSMLAIAVIAGAAVSSVLAFGQAANWNFLGIWSLDSVPGMRPYANLGQPNNLATLMGLGTAAVLLLYAQRQIGPITSFVLACVFVIGAAMSQSRTALAFGPLLLVGCLLAKQRGLNMRVPVWGVGVFCFAHLVLTWLWPAIQSSFFESAPPSLVERGIGSVRLQVWPVLLDAIWQRPWFGYGWLQVGAAQLAAAEGAAPVGELWLHAHNLLLDLVVWCGVPAGMLLCGAFLYWFVSRWLRVQTIEGLCGILAISIFGTHAMLELPHHYAYFLIPVGLWTGIVESTLPSYRPLPSRWILIPAIVSVVLVAAIWKDYPAVEEDFRSVRFEGVGVGSPPADSLAPRAPFLSSLTEFLRFARTAPRSGMTIAELDRMEAIVKRYPYAQSLYRYGVALALNGRMSEAKQQFVRMRHIHGELHYARLKSQLAENAGDKELQALLNSLPE